eukprot:m51a1_g13311 hypothetical protein (470) ;mRNA; r:248-1869
MSCVRLALFKPFFFPGDRVDGVVELAVESAVRVHRVRVRWGGGECVKTLYATSREPRTEREGLVLEGSAEYASLQLPAGEHSLPFCFFVPPDAPASFAFAFETASATVTHSVKYSVRASVQLADGGPEVDAPKLPLLVGAAEPPLLPCGPQQSATTATATTATATTTARRALHESASKGFLLARGQLRLEYWVDDNGVAEGGTLRVRVRLENGSSKRVERLKAILLREYTSRRTALGEAVQRSVEVQREFYEGVGEMATDDRAVDVHLPRGIGHTVVGKFVTTEFYVVLECDVPMAIDLSVKFPIVVLPELRRAPPAPSRALSQSLEAATRALEESSRVSSASPAAASKKESEQRRAALKASAGAKRREEATAAQIMARTREEELAAKLRAEEEEKVRELMEEEDRRQREYLEAQRAENAMIHQMQKRDAEYTRRMAENRRNEEQAQIARLRQEEERMRKAASRNPSFF